MKSRTDRLSDAAPLMLKLIRKATHVLSLHVLPVTAMTDRKAVLEFYSIFDGPAYRTMKRKLTGKIRSSPKRVSPDLKSVSLIKRRKPPRSGAS